MSGRRKLAALIAGVVVVLLAIPPLALMAIDAGALNGALIGAFEAKTHRNLSFKALHPQLLSADPAIEVEQLVIGSPPAITRFDLVHVGAGTLHMRLLPLLLGRLVLTEVALKDVDLHMVRLGHGHNNYSFGGGAGLTATLAPVRRMALTNGHVEYDDPQRSLTLIGAAAYDPADPKLPLHLAGGGVIRGEPYQVTARGTPLIQRDAKSPYAFQARLRDGAVHATVAGATQKPFDFRGFDLQVAADGPNLADLGYLFNFDSPNTPPYQLTTRISRKAHAVHLAQIKARIGGSDIQGDLISDHDQPRRRFSVDFAADTLRAEDLAVMASPRPDHAAARSRPGAAAPSTAKALFSAKPFDVDGLRKVDAAVKLRARRVTGYAIPINDLNLGLNLLNGRLEVQPFTATLAPGAFKAHVILDARPANPDLKISGDLRGARIGALRPTAAATLDGNLDVVTNLETSGSSAKAMAAHLNGKVAVRVDHGMIQRSKAEALGGDLLQAAWLTLLDKKADLPLRCVSGRFAVANGVASPQALTIDSDAGETIGRGAINLATEQIDMTFQPAGGGAKPTVTAPVRIVGDLSHPKAEVNAKAAVQKAGLRTIAAAIMTPFRAASEKQQSAPPSALCSLNF